MTPEQLQLYIDAAIAKHDSFQLIYFVAAPFIFFLAGYLVPYLKTKGVNLATKEDIGDVTKAVESVKSTYTENLEVIRSELSSKSHYSKIRYEREMEVFRLIWPTLHDLKESVLSLRPVRATSREPGETHESRKKVRADKYVEALSRFNLAVQHNRPFYSHDIWNALRELSDISWSEAMEWRLATDRKGDYYEKGIENQKRISDKVDEIAELIRKRLSDFD